MRGKVENTCSWPALNQPLPCCRGREQEEDMTRRTVARKRYMYLVICCYYIRVQRSARSPHGARIRGSDSIPVLFVHGNAQYQLYAYTCTARICRVGNEQDGAQENRKIADNPAELVCNLQRPNLVTYTRPYLLRFGGSHPFIPSLVDYFASTSCTRKGRALCLVCSRGSRRPLSSHDSKKINNHLSWPLSVQ